MTNNILCQWKCIMNTVNGSIRGNILYEVKLIILAIDWNIYFIVDINSSKELVKKNDNIHTGNIQLIFTGQY